MCWAVPVPGFHRPGASHAPPHSQCRRRRGSQRAAPARPSKAPPRTPSTCPARAEAGRGRRRVRPGGRRTRPPERPPSAADPRGLADPRRPRPAAPGVPGRRAHGHLTSPPQQQRGHRAVHAAGQGAHDVPRRQHQPVTQLPPAARAAAAPEAAPGHCVGVGVRGPVGNARSAPGVPPFRGYAPGVLVRRTDPEDLEFCTHGSLRAARSSGCARAASWAPAGQEGGHGQDQAS